MNQKTALQLAAEKILKQADERIAQNGHYEIHSCDTWSYGWNKDEHQALYALYRSQPKGYHKPTRYAIMLMNG